MTADQAFEKCLEICRSWIDERRSEDENAMAQAIAGDILTAQITAKQKNG